MNRENKDQRSKLTINKLYRINENNNNKKIKVYDYIYRIIENIIEKSAKNNLNYCHYQIPPFILGYPIYDINEVKMFLINELNEAGFHVVLLDENWIQITWSLHKESDVILNNDNDNEVVSNDELIQSLIKLKNSNYNTNTNTKKRK